MAEPNIAQKVFRCWKRGSGIRETMVSLERTEGIRLTFDEVRTHFIALSNQFSAPAMPPPATLPKQEETSHVRY